MKRILLSTAVLLLAASLAHAEDRPGRPSAGAGTTTGDPAASSANSGTGGKSVGNSLADNPSRSGTSSSGGKDDNGDAGRDKMDSAGTNNSPAADANRRATSGSAAPR